MNFRGVDRTRTESSTDTDSNWSAVGLGLDEFGSL